MSRMGMVGKTAGAIRSILCAAVIALVATTGWAAWTHGVSGGFDVWSWDGSQKFRYDLTNTQWGNYSTVGSAWYTLGATGRPDTFIGDGGWYGLGNGFSFSYSTAADLAWFKKGTAGRFGYYYSLGRWMTVGNTGGWQFLGNAGLTASFLGDGIGWHDLNNGFTYSYVAASDLSYFKKGGTTYRFGYYHGLTRWVAAGNTGGWQLLGNTGLSASFLGDGIGWHDLKNGFTYSYNLAADLGYFRKGGTTNRFAYFYLQRRWLNAGNTGSWQNLGATGLSASFLGDGTQHNLSNGFWYTYSGGGDAGVWSTDGTSSGDRYKYGYTPGQWELRGYGGGWNVLGNTGRSSSFMGDSAYHALGNGFYYQAFSTMGYWSTDGTGTNDRYRYTYSTGQWGLRGYGGGWNALGNAGLSSQFMGDSAYHALGNGFYYQAFSTMGYWSTDGTGTNDRYRYTYSTGQWGLRGYGGGWNVLGNAGRSSSFMGDSAYHALGTGYYYQGPTSTTGYWSTDGTGTNDRYRYTYSTGQWELRGYGGGFFYLGDAGRTSSFMGDSAYHPLGNGYYYQGLGTDAVWSTDGTGTNDRYRYTYSTGQWELRGYGGGWNVLGTTGRSSSFMGDSLYHVLGNDFYYQGLGTTAYWSTNGFTSGDVYRYTYSTGLWEHQGPTGAPVNGFNPLGHAGMSTSFLGDGQPHLVNMFYFQYVSGVGTWLENGSPLVPAYRYVYATGEWYFKDPYGSGEWYLRDGPGVGTNLYNIGEPS